jgi:hypothetical protein
VPATFLVRPPEEAYPIGFSAMATQQMEERLVRVAANAGWIPQERFEATRPARLSWAFAPDPSVFTPEVLADPGQFLEALQASAALRGSDR